MACTSQNLSRRFRFYSLYFPELSTLIWRGDLIHHCYKKPWKALKKRYVSELYFQIVIFSICLLWQIGYWLLVFIWQIAKGIYKKYFISILFMSLAKGQLFSKCLFSVFKFSQKTNKKNLIWGNIEVKSNFLFVSWENCRYQKDILKLTDLYQSLDRF